MLGAHKRQGVIISQSEASDGTFSQSETWEHSHRASPFPFLCPVNTWNGRGGAGPALCLCNRDKINKEWQSWRWAPPLETGKSWMWGLTRVLMWHRACIAPKPEYIGRCLLTRPHGTDMRHRTWHWQLVTGTTLHGPSYLGQPLGGPGLWSQSRSTSSLIPSDTGHSAPWVTSLLHLSHRRRGIPRLCLSLHFTGSRKPSQDQFMTYKVIKVLKSEKICELWTLWSR